MQMIVIQRGMYSGTRHVHHAPPRSHLFTRRHTGRKHRRQHTRQQQARKGAALARSTETTHGNTGGGEQRRAKTQEQHPYSSVARRSIDSAICTLCSRQQRRAPRARAPTLSTAHRHAARGAPGVLRCRLVQRLRLRHFLVGAARLRPRVRRAAARNRGKAVRAVSGAADPQRRGRSASGAAREHADQRWRR